jgi:hypothetical protein
MKINQIHLAMDRCIGNTRFGYLTTLLLGLLCVLVFSLLPSPTSALTTVPTKMHFQGRLTDTSGNIKANGNYNMKLRLYDAASGGTLKYSEDRLVSAGAPSQVTVTNGLFSIKIGDGSNKTGTFDASIFASGGLYLEIELPTPATATSTTPTWTEGAMTPRNQLLTTAYAYNAETIDGLDSDALGQLGANNTWTGTNNFNGSSVFDTSTLTVDVTNDRVGVGTAGAAVRLDVGANGSGSEYIAVRSQNRAGIYLYADSDNDGSESGSPFVEFFQDSTGTNGILGMSQNAGTTATGAAYTDLTANTLLLGTYSTHPLAFGTGGAVRMTVSGSGDVTIGSATNGVVFTVNGATYAGTARATKTVTLVPEYPGATFTGDGSNNTGSLSSDFCSHSALMDINTTACNNTNDEHNYYAWANTQATAQDYDLYVRYRIPVDYDTGSMTNLSFWAWGTTGANEIASLALHKASGTACTTITDAVTTNTTWTETTAASPLGSCTINSGDYVTFKIKLTAGQNNTVRAGEINFTYRSKN